MVSQGGFSILIVVSALIRSFSAFLNQDLTTSSLSSFINDPPFVCGGVNDCSDNIFEPFKFFRSLDDYILGNPDAFQYFPDRDRSFMRLFVRLHDDHYVHIAINSRMTVSISAKDNYLIRIEVFYNFID